MKPLLERQLWARGLGQQLRMYAAYLGCVYECSALMCIYAACACRALGSQNRTLDRSLNPYFSPNAKNSRLCIESFLGTYVNFIILLYQTVFHFPSLLVLQSVGFIFSILQYEKKYETMLVKAKQSREHLLLQF